MTRAERMRAYQASRTPEERSEAARKGHRTRAKGAHSEAMRAWQATRTPEERAETIRRARAFCDASELARRAYETRRKKRGAMWDLAMKQAEPKWDSKKSY